MAEIETKKLVIISEFLSPTNFPKKPDIIAPNKGRNNNKVSTLSFQIIYFFNSYGSRVSIIDNNNC